jgi:hypothetical protein
MLSPPSTHTQFKDEKMNTQRSQIICPRSLTYILAMLIFEIKFICLQSLFSFQLHQRTKTKYQLELNWDVLLESLEEIKSNLLGTGN